MIITYYFDIDGFMGNLELHYLNLFGHKMDDAPSKNVMWGYLHSHPDFFLGMPLMEGAKDFYNDYKWLNPVFLTACPRDKFQEVAAQKRQWVRNNLSKTAIVIPSYESVNKPAHMNAPGDVLIDDWRKNIHAWEAAGGVGIKHENFEDTRAELNWHLHKLRVIDGMGG